jgi:predicted amidohydrolase
MCRDPNRGRVYRRCACRDTWCPVTDPVFEMDRARVSLAICYEVGYDYVLNEAALAGAQLLAVPTNNAWFGRGEMTYQQLAMSRLRAVEHGRAVVVASTSGVSAIVQPRRHRDEQHAPVHIRHPGRAGAAAIDDDAGHPARQYPAMGADGRRGAGRGRDDPDDPPSRLRPDPEGAGARRER